MKILNQIAIIFFLCLSGEAIAYILPFPLPLPSSIIAMFLLLLALFSGFLKIDHIKEKSDFLLQNMAFFFIPAGVKVIEHLDLISAMWWQLLVIIVASTVFVFLITALSVSLALKLERRIRR